MSERRKGKGKGGKAGSSGHSGWWNDWGWNSWYDWPSEPRPNSDALLNTHAWRRRERPDTRTPNSASTRQLSASRAAPPAAPPPPAPPVPDEWAEGPEDTEVARVRIARSEDVRGVDQSAKEEETATASPEAAEPPDAAVSTAVSADLSQTTERGASAAAGNAWEMNPDHSALHSCSAQLQEFHQRSTGEPLDAVDDWEEMADDLVAFEELMPWYDLAFLLWSGRLVGSSATSRTSAVPAACLATWACRKSQTVALKRIPIPRFHRRLRWSDP
eukprot:g22328.t1